MNVWTHNAEDKTWIKIYQLPDYYTHCAAVRRIKFNKRLSDESSFVISTCANDHSVRLYRLKL
jgi:hypothetical protein